MRGVSQIEPKATVVVIFERPLRPVLRFRDQAFGHRQLGEDLARGAKQQLALLGQDQAARMAVEQRHAEAFLERADLPADRRLAEIQRLAGMGEAARLGDRVKDPQLVPIHRHVRLPAAPPARFARRRYSAARAAAASSCAARNFSASSAAMQPIPAAVTAWRNTLSLTSPAANTPGTRSRSNRAR